MPKRRQTALDAYVRPVEDSSMKRFRWSGGLLCDRKSVIQAFAEYEDIQQNVFVERKRRNLSQNDLPLCNCQPAPNGALTCGEGCENRAMQVECLIGGCASKSICQNQRLQRREFPFLYIDKVWGKGIGLMADQRIEKSDIIAEYVGEILPKQLYEERLQGTRPTSNLYGMALDNEEVIDATYRGGIARFANHDANPNAEVQRWEVNGETCCALYALTEIAENEEITFDYGIGNILKWVSAVDADV